MPPKQAAGSKKVVEKQKQKIIEDKTFGLKNKKGKKTQQVIKQVTQQVKQTNVRKAPAEVDKKQIKEEKTKQLEELNALFKPVIDKQKIAAGVDPKSVVCMYFKQGLCMKGDKCKFSHDLAVERKSEKRSLYVDSRFADIDGADLENDTMDKWDQDKLQLVVDKKHGESSNKNRTEIVCKYFLEAIDKNIYGWFWTCPNGGDACIYRHALPPGFELKKKEKDSTKEEISLEELIEQERSQLGDNLTPVNLSTFNEWKKRKITEKKLTYEIELKRKKEEFISGRNIGKVSGREMFTFNPDLVADDDDEAVDDPNLYEREGEDQAVPFMQITEDSLTNSRGPAIPDDRITRANTLNPALREQTGSRGSTFAAADDDVGGDDDDEVGERSEQVSSEGDADEAANGTDCKDLVLDGVPVDESLFDDLPVDELDQLDLDGVS